MKIQLIRVFQSTVSEFRFKGVKTISYIVEQHPYAVDACKMLPSLAEDEGRDCHDIVVTE